MVTLAIWPFSTKAPNPTIDKLKSNLIAAMTTPTFRLSALLLAMAALTACDKLPKPKAAQTPTPAPSASPTPKPTPAPTPTPFAVDTSSQVSVLGYHRFEKKPRDPLAIAPDHFRKQMQTVKDSGIPVIPMADFLAWRSGKKNIPPKAIVITIDDGYNDAYTEGVADSQGIRLSLHLLRLHELHRRGRPLDSLGSIGRNEPAGVDIGSHTVSHDNLVKPKKLNGMAYDQWLANELKGSKDMIEGKLGIKLTTLAYPFGVHNDNVAAKTLEAGYQAAFTVNGQKALYGSPAGKIGRYIVQSDKEFTFANALKFGGSAGGDSAVEGNPAAASMLTQPMQGETISNPRPEIKVNLATFGQVDPKTVEMRISGFGIVPATYDPATQLLSYTMHQRLREHSVTVIVSARAGGRKAVANWTFQFDPNAAPTPAPASAASSTPTDNPFVPPAPTPGGDSAGIPPMKPAE